MTLDKSSKVECKFHNIVMLYNKDKMFFHLSYWHDGNGRTDVVMCLKAWAQMNALFSSCEGIILWPMDNMFVPILHGPIKIMVIEMPNPSMEGKYVSMFQVKRVQISTLFANNTKGLNTSIQLDSN
jgi:hypothetical protein